ncbi:GPW/gp25 family protein [Sphingopyxis sp.]|jgi:phage baseplate assembly protein W|uniref:GPW/gp25 family protein n=1 Tax=Sphingopyxis sp. TaxID=1908224 RepID=UPI002DFF9C51|nr:GPW/gp25 family protein [Sphingopyxis sp.]
MSRLAFPFDPARDGRATTVAYGGSAHVRQMLELLILTMAGERVMRPDLGSPVRQLLFGAGEGATAIALEAALQATINQWLGDMLTLHELTVDFDGAEAILEIQVAYEVHSTRTDDRFSIRKELT